MKQKTAVERLVTQMGPMRVGEDVLPYGPRDEVIDQAQHTHNLEVLWPKNRNTTVSKGSLRVGQAHTPVVYHERDLDTACELWLDANDHIWRAGTSPWALFHTTNEHHGKKVARALKRKMEERGEWRGQYEQPDE